MTKLSEIKASELAEKVREIALADPDHLYVADGLSGRCAYYHAEEPGCIVGWGLAALGVSADEVGNYNEGYGVQSLPLLVDGTDHTEWLSRVQASQDQNTQWGRAVEAADKGCIVTSYGEEYSDD